MKKLMKNYGSINSLNKNSDDLKILIKNYGSIDSLNKNYGSKIASTRTLTI